MGVGNQPFGKRGTNRSALPRAGAALAGAASLAIPAIAGAITPDPANPSPTIAANTSGSFTAEFTPFLGRSLPDLQIPEDAVDLEQIEPPLESAIERSLGTGVASFYGRKFHGRRTASGERFDMNAMTAAHRTLPFGTRVKVTNPRNGKSVTVRINDRGPFSKGRTIDLSRAAAEQLGMVNRGHGEVVLELLP